MNIVYRNSNGTKDAARCTLEQIMKIIKGSPKMKEQIDVIRAEKSKAKRSELKDNLKLFHLIDLKNPKVGVADGEPIQTGVMGFDVDLNYPGMDKYRAENPEVSPEDVKRAREAIIKHPACLYAFASPSGGLKFAIKTDVNHGGEEYHAFAYRKLKEVFDTKLVHVDDIHDLQHAVYFSYDENLYYNPDCETMQLSERLIDDFNSQREIKLRERKANMERLEKMKGGVHRTDKAWDHVEKEINRIFDATGPGNRHSSMYDVSQTCFFAGFGIDEATYALGEMRAIGKSDPDVRDLRKAAESHYKWWLEKHGVPNARFFGINAQEQNKSYESLLEMYS